MVAALSVFLISLVGIISLLGFKAWEVRRQHVVARELRNRIDAGAVALKHRLEALEHVLERFPIFASFFAFTLLTTMTVQFARMARGASEAAHRLADFISHKHNFERREVRSEFLKTVIEHKNGLAKPAFLAGKKKKPPQTIETMNNDSISGESRGQMHG